MSAAVERDDATAFAAPNLPALQTPYAVAPVVDDGDERWGGNALPGDHPAWFKDTVSISQRARAIVARLKPVAVRVLTYWEHKLRSIVCNGRRLSVDPSGSYRLD